MAVTYKNTFNNVITALKSKLRTEIKCPVISDFDEVRKSNQFIRLIAAGSSQEEIMVHSETRVFQIDLQYIFLKRKQSAFQQFVLENTSRLEALIHDNPTLTLADSSKAFNVIIGDLELGFEDDELEDYFIAQYNFNCTHIGNYS